MRQTSFGRMKSFIFLYIWNQKCSIQYLVLHTYYTAWFSLVRLFFSLPSLPKLFICGKILIRNINKNIHKFEKHPSLKYIYINSFWGKYVLCMQTVMSLWNRYLASDIIFSVLNAERKTKISNHLHSMNNGRQMLQ
jgi:hypothetical protein